MFITRNDVGTGVLLAMGALFLLMATTGHPVTSAKLGNNEINMARQVAQVRRGVEQVLDGAPKQIQPEIAEVILQSDLPANDPLRVQAAAIAVQEAARDYEQEIFGALGRLGVSDIHSLHEHGRGYDAIFEYNGITLAIEITIGISERVGPSLVLLAFDRLLSFSLQPITPQGLIFVSSTGFTAQADLLVTRHLGSIPMALVSWRSAADDDALRVALSGVISRTYRGTPIR